MHLLTFIQLRQPGPVFRAAVLVAQVRGRAAARSARAGVLSSRCCVASSPQGVVYNAFFISYLLSPKTCHRFVGYLEEEAVKTYTHAIADLDAGKLPMWTVRENVGRGARDALRNR